MPRQFARKTGARAGQLPRAKVTITGRRSNYTTAADAGAIDFDRLPTIFEDAIWFGEDGAVFRMDM